MAKTIDQRMAAEMDGAFVVFLIGMRVNKPWKLHKWLPVFLGMPRMLKELEVSGEESGFLGHTGLGPTVVQYWRSFEHLEAYARNREKSHWPAWQAFNRSVGRSRGDVGIWHEAYEITPGRYETAYSGMPPRGLGAIGRLIPATGRRETAAQRRAATGAAPGTG